METVTPDDPESTDARKPSLIKRLGLAVTATAVVAFGLLGFAIAAPASSPAPACNQWNVKAKSHAVVDGRYVQSFVLDDTCRLEVLSFTATGPSWPNNQPQVRFDRWVGTRGPGAHTVSVKLPNCFFQADLVVENGTRVIDTAVGGTAPCVACPPASA